MLTGTGRWAAVAAVSVAALAAAAGKADVVTERWGIAGRVQHPGTLTYDSAEAGGRLARFDLAAIPRSAEVYRARLLMARSRGYAAGFEGFATRPGPDGKATPAKEPLRPVPPYCRWFDVTESVRAWVGSGARSAVFGIRGRGYDRKATCLEIAYAGKLADPPQQVSGVRAFYRAGQVFITFKEVEDLTEGNDRFGWGSLIKKTRGYTADGIVPRDEKRALRYRVYRHDAPITKQTIGAAKLLAEVLPASGVNTRMVRRIWQGENVPSKLDDAFIAVRLAVEANKPVPSGTGVYVHTVRKASESYYAVVTAVNGVENTADLAGAAAGPVSQKVAPPEPVGQAETYTKGRYRSSDDVIVRRYALWAAPPLSPRPLQYRIEVQYYPNRIPKPAPLEVSHGMAHAFSLARRQRAEAIVLVYEDGPENGFYVGANICHRTLKSYRQGTWAPWTYRRQARIVEWARGAYEIDDQQIYCYGSHWGMWELRHPEIFSVFVGWGSAELTRGFVDWNRANGVWGPPSAYAGKPDGENPYVMCNFNDYVSADPARKLPVQFLISCTGSHTSEMSYMSLPKYKRILMDAKQPFGAGICKVSWGFKGTAALREWRAGKLKILRDQSKPAFANCSLDDNPGSGDLRSGDATGMLHGYLLWRSEDITDEPARWEMTVYLDASAPLDACTVDLTPRHCQKFKAKAGQKFQWTNTSVAEKKVLESGTVAADKHGLVTLPQLTVTKGRNRVAIFPAR